MLSSLRARKTASATLDALTLFAGLAGLWYGTQITVRNAVFLAGRLGMSELVVGIAILSVGSDIPELAIAIDASLRNLATGTASGVVVGTAIGSSLAQIGFVLGLVGLFGYITVPKQVVFRHGSVMLGSIVFLALAGLDGFVSRTEGATLVAVYLFYFAFLLTDKQGSSSESTDGKSVPLLKISTGLAIGLVIVAAGSELTVYAVVNISDSFGLNQGLIAIFLIGIGSSLPELSISLTAVLKKKTRLSVGNLIGSNIFDTLIPVGVGGMISTLTFDRTMLVFDLPALAFVSMMALFYFAQVKGIQKREAITVIAVYFLYATTRVLVEL